MGTPPRGSQDLTAATTRGLDPAGLTPRASRLPSATSPPGSRCHGRRLAALPPGRSVSQLQEEVGFARPTPASPAARTPASSPLISTPRPHRRGNRFEFLIFICSGKPRATRSQGSGAAEGGRLHTADRTCPRPQLLGEPRRPPSLPARRRAAAGLPKTSSATASAGRSESPRPERAWHGRGAGRCV